MAWSKKETEQREAGRPSKYTEELAALFCARISNGESLRKICKDEDMPSAPTVFNWMRTHEVFLKQYARACEERTEAMAEDMQEIAENVDLKNGLSVQKARLQIDTMKWLMSKQKPKKYGDKLDVTSDGKALPTPIYGGKSGESTKD